MPQVDQVSSSCPSIGAILYYPHLSPFNESSVWVRNIPGWKIVVFSVRPQFALPKLPGGTILRLKETGFFISNFQLGGQTCDAGELEIGGLGHLLLSSKIKGLWNLSKKKTLQKGKCSFSTWQPSITNTFCLFVFFPKNWNALWDFSWGNVCSKTVLRSLFSPQDGKFGLGK